MSKRVSLPGADAFFDGSAPAAPAKKPVKHDEKITVYLSSEALFDIEQARLELARHGIRVDRGRLVREATAMVLADFAENGADSHLVKRLS